VHQIKVQDVNDLMQCLTDVWAAAEQSIINNAPDQQRRHLHVCIQATGGHFENSL